MQDVPSAACHLLFCDVVVAVPSFIVNPSIRENTGKCTSHPAIHQKVSQAKLCLTRRRLPCPFLQLWLQSRLLTRLMENPPLLLALFRLYKVFERSSRRKLRGARDI